jgi:amino acid transporter
MTLISPSAPPSPTLAPVPSPAASEIGPRLHGRMGTVELVFSVLAFAAPLAVVSGLVPFVIAFNGRGAPAAYLAAMVILLLFAVGLAAMTRYVPKPGAFYAYVTSGLGRVAGLGAASLAIYAYWLLAVASYAFFGSAAARLVAETFHGPDVAWCWYALAGIAMCGVLGYRNIELSAKVLAVAMALEVLIVLVFDVAVAAKGGAHGLSAAPLGWSAFTGGTVGVAVLFSVLCFLGFESTAIYREEAKNPEKTIPRAMYLSVVLIGVFYVAAALAVVLAYGQAEAVDVAGSNPSGMFGDAVHQYLNGFLVDTTGVLLVSSIFASLVAVQNMLSRYLYSLGKDGAMDRRLGTVHRQHHSPHVASLVVTSTIIVGVLPFIVAGSDPMLLYGRMAGVGTFAITILMLLASIAVVVYFRRSPQPDATLWQSTIAPGLAAVGLAGIVYLALENFSTLSGLTGTGAVVPVIVTLAVLAGGMALGVCPRAAA